MDKPFYDFDILEDAFKYEFISVGHLNIKKIIVYQTTNLPDFYSLTLADVLPNGELDVFSESKNGDMEKVLATVIQTIQIFLSRYPNAKIAFSGRLEYFIVSAAKAKSTFPILPEDPQYDLDRKSTRMNSSHQCLSRMPSSA